MSVSRSVQAALAALLAGPVAYGAPAPAAFARGGLDAAPPAAVAAVAPRMTPAPASDPALPPPATGLEAVTPSEPQADMPPARSDRPAAAVAPADPQAAAVFNRLAAPAPLLARLTAKEREAIQAFYALGAFKPVWIVGGAYTAAAKAVAARLVAAAEDGLDARAYPVPALASPPRPDDHAAVAEADLKLSAAAVLYARDARGGRINLAAISRLITPVLDLPAADTVLSGLAGAGGAAGDRLQAYNPRSPGYLALKGRLSTAPAGAPKEAADAGTALRLPPGPALRLGMRDSRVPLLRARFGLENRSPGTLDAAPGEPEDYDAGVAAAVAGFQRARGLPGNGVLNVQTVMALAGAGAEARPRAAGDDAALIVNMERWRWLGSDLGPDYVLVNVPEFRLRVFRDGRQRDEARVIVGKPDSRTPLFSGLMEYAVVNPSWYVPPSILKTMLPKIASYGGGTWGGYEVVRSGGHVSLRQPPGERNALGFIKFMFPNNHAVYLHDTPNRALFSRAERALSHGCVRVDDPFRFADSVMPAAWSSERLRKLVGKGERTIRLERKLPVHLAYFTATVDEAGLYRTLPDLYGYDAPMRAALGLPGGGGAVARLAPTLRPSEPVRRAAVLVDAPPRPKPRHAAVPRRAVRASAEAPPPEFGEPGLWTPPPAPASRSWW
ncbi:murein L,D-transpeptidase [uncultured Methylobacterium sp.]|uniref:L,D-transpeptidase family protein n=1 Tax=uncultured Methylobacterium sp. TaxID=157278 RepID=UPI0035CC83D4